MRNLHLERLYYNTPEFVAILHELGVSVEPERNKQTIRRFLLGEKLAPISSPVRSEVKTNIEIPATSHGKTISEFFGRAEAALRGSLAEKGISEDKIVNIELLCPSDGEGLKYFVEYLAPEPEGKFALRIENAELFNQMLRLQGEIYQKVDALVASRHHQSK